MSGVKSNAPSFGMRGGHRSSNNGSHTTKHSGNSGPKVPPPMGLKLHHVPQEDTKIPITDLSKNSDGHVGDIVFNTSDSLLYYHTGHQWIPIAIMDLETRNTAERLSTLMTIDDEDIFFCAPNNENINITAGNNAPGVGGNVLLSAGQGGLDDGTIYLNIGTDQALTIHESTDVTVDSGNFTVTRGDCVVKNGNLELHDPVGMFICNIARATASQTVDDTDTDSDTASDDDTKTTDHHTKTVYSTVDTLVMNCMTGILTLKVELDSGNEITGIVQNNVVQANSWINITPVCASGCPLVWVNSVNDGEFTYTTSCAAGNITELQLHFEVRNAL